LSKPLASLALSINFSDKNKVLDELTSIEGNLKIRDVEINGIFDYALSQKSPLDKNKVYRLIFLGSLNKKIGEETILNEWSDERESIVETPYLIYNDSRKENLEILLKPWTDVLNTFGK
jgi:hypothetical protein